VRQGGQDDVFPNHFTSAGAFPSSPSFACGKEAACEGCGRGGRHMDERGPRLRPDVWRRRRVTRCGFFRDLAYHRDETDPRPPVVRGASIEAAAFVCFRNNAQLVPHEVLGELTVTLCEGSSSCDGESENPLRSLQPEAHCEKELPIAWQS
jgi:hypothetical protein